MHLSGACQRKLSVLHISCLAIDEYRALEQNLMRQIVDYLFDQFKISIQNLRPLCPQLYIVLGTHRQYVSIVFLMLGYFRKYWIVHK